MVLGAVGVVGGGEISEQPMGRVIFRDCYIGTVVGACRKANRSTNKFLFGEANEFFVPVIISARYCTAHNRCLTVVVLVRQSRN